MGLRVSESGALLGAEGLARDPEHQGRNCKLSRLFLWPGCCWGSHRCRVSSHPLLIVHTPKIFPTVPFALEAATEGYLCLPQFTC